MIQNVLHHIGGVGIYGVLSVCLFFAFFATVLLWALCIKKPYVDSMQQLPLDDERSSRPPEPNHQSPITNRKSKSHE